jgi:hypothetical protein
VNSLIKLWNAIIRSSSNDFGKLKGDGGVEEAYTYNSTPLCTSFLSPYYSRFSLL